MKYVLRIKITNTPSRNISNLTNVRNFGLYVVRVHKAFNSILYTTSLYGMDKYKQH